MSKGYGGVDISDDDTEISDVDPDEMAKMIQDVDDLDSTLFGPTLEKRLGQNKRGPVKPALHPPKDSADKPKTHVGFADDVDFDDDLLEDLLSLDGGDKKRNNLSKNTPAPQPSRFERGDGLGANTAAKATPIVRESSDWLGLRPVDSPVKAVDSRVGPAKESAEQRNDETNAGKIVSDKSLPETLGRPATSVVPETRSGVIPRASPRKTDPSPFATGDSRPGDGSGSWESRAVASKSTGGSVAPRESRRRRNSSGFVDPLGLFATPAVQEDRADSFEPGQGFAAPQPTKQSVPKPQSVPTKQSVPKSQSVPTLQSVPKPRASDKVDAAPVQDDALPSWLGGTGDAKPKRIERAENGDRTLSPRTKRGSGEVKAALERAGTDPGGVVEENLLRLVAGTSVEQQTAASLERQELQLTAALQLKHHEDRLAMMLGRQQMTLQRQEEQLQTLVDRQLQRQEMIEQQMREQQNRINVHINTLTCQPGLPTLAPPSNVEATNHQRTLSSLESEIAQLCSTLETLQGKHSEEMAWVKESYKRQLEMSETSLRDQESRLKAECANLARDYETRLVRSEEEIKSLRAQNAERVATLRAEHAAEVQRLRAEQDNAIQDLRKHQDFLLEHMTNSWKAERANSHASQDPAVLSSILNEVAQCKQAVAELHDRAQSLHQAGKTEAQLADVQEALSRQRAAAEEERARLQSLVASLERDAARQRGQFDEDRQAMRLDIARLERERSSAVDHTERERRELQKLKEDVLASANEEKTKIDETKLWLATERSRLATLARLHDDGKKAVDAERAEAEAALRVAQGAARSADENRERLLAERLAVAQEQRRLEHLRLNLGRKAQDLDNLSQLAVATKEEGLRALESAAQREREQTARAVAIQRQAEALAERERKLSEEKQTISRERVGLRICEPQKRSTWVMADTAEKAVVDPRLVIMKLKAGQDNSFGELDSRYISSYFSISK